MISGFRHTQRPPSKLLTVLFLRRRWRKFSPTTPIRTRRTATRLPARKLRRRAPPALRRFKKGINKFTDMSEAEINRYKGKRPVRPLAPFTPTKCDRHIAAHRSPSCETRAILPAVHLAVRLLTGEGRFAAAVHRATGELHGQPQASFRSAPEPDTPSMVHHTAWSSVFFPCPPAPFRVRPCASWLVFR